MIEPSIFKKYDIRGKAGDTLTEEGAALIGQAFGTFLQDNGVREVIVGRDNRHSSPGLARAAIGGLVRAGRRVTDIGMVATPLVYWCAVEAGNVGGLMITGSHLKPEMNGFKLSIGKDNLYGEQIQALRGLIERGDLREGEGETHADEDASARYLAMVEGKLRRARPLKIVIDAGNGMGGVYGAPLLEALGHRVVCLYCAPDGSYPHHQPDPQVPENLSELSALVVREGADLGLAFDGDADRVGVVDDQGHPISADRVLVLLARDTLARHPGATVVADVLSTCLLYTSRCV